MPPTFIITEDIMMKTVETIEMTDETERRTIIETIEGGTTGIEEIITVTNAGILEIMIVIEETLVDETSATEMQVTVPRGPTRSVRIMSPMVDNRFHVCLLHLPFPRKQS